MRRPPGYLTCVDVELHLLGRVVPMTLDLYGHRVNANLPDSCMVVDSVMVEQNDITVEIPSEALEILTHHVNTLAVKP